jgi:acyl-CoA synthetase
MGNVLLTLLSAAGTRQFYAAGHWRDDTIYSLVRGHARATPEKVAIRERFRTVTYGALVDGADRLAAALRREGLRPGQRVAVWLPSRIETAVAVLACSRNGYVCSPSFHRDHTVGEVVDLMKRMQAAALIAEVGYGADAHRVDVFTAAGELEALRLVVRLEPLGAQDSEHQLLAELPAAVSDDVRADPDSVVYLAFTSGTTGIPKGVMHSDNTLLAPVRALAADWDLDTRMVIYTLSPLSHNLGFGAMVLALTGGGELVVHDLARAASLAQRLVQTGATFLFGVPTHAIDLLAELRESPLKTERIRGFRISGAPVPPFVAQGLIKLGIVPQSGYGMTESGSHHYTLPGDDPRLIIESSGRPGRGHEAKVFAPDDPDRELPAGDIGQIGGRGAFLMLGYFGDQTATEASFNADGWFMTGDLGWMDDAGYIRITGRKKDLIIRGGHNIFPAKIEQLTMQHDGVDRAAAIPVADPRLGEKVCLALTAKPGWQLAADEILQHLDAAGLSRFDMPEYFLALDEMPLLPSGKLAKRELVARIEAGQLTPTPIRFRPTG